MHRRTTALTTAFVATFLVAGMSAPAFADSAKPALNSVNCNGRADFLEFWNVNGNGPTCYANSGDTNVDLDNVGCWSSGNNSGSFDTTDGIRYSFGTWESACFDSPGVEIIHLHIN